MKITDKIKSRMTDGVGKKVIFGIRPEDIFHPDYVASGINVEKVEASVDVTELMGNEIFLYLMSGETSYIARIDPRGHVQPGDKIEMVFNADNIHLFDAEAENQPTLLKVG